MVMLVTEREQELAAKNFSTQWKARGNEKSDTQIFWLTLFRDVFGREKPEQYFEFEVPVSIGKNNSVDALIPSTKVLIEQKSFDIELDKPARQSDGEFLTPFEQAKRYAEALPSEKYPRWIVTCNFKEIWIYDFRKLKAREEFQKMLMSNSKKFQITEDQRRIINGEPIKISVERLVLEYKRLNFLVDPKDDKVDPEVLIAKWAADIVNDLRKSFEDSYKKSATPNYLDSLNKLCVRLVFCLYAEDASVFEKNQFYNYLKDIPDVQKLAALKELFEVLNLPVEKRQNLNESLKNFPYVNGGLFDEKIDVPKFNAEINYYLLTIAVDCFNWRGINPIIFGALFESVLNPDTRRAGGMHYTSVANIHKVIDPLFMDELNEEFKTIKRARKDKIQRLKNFQDKLASLKFFDPACGSGNFLTATYISLRTLENEVIREINRGAANILLDNPIKVSINQFYGIEINDFAVAVAQTAMWIAEHQMLTETQMILHKDFDALPLKKFDNIQRKNALEIDWSDVVDKDKLSYIIGNPPFVGYTYQTPQQKADLLSATGLKTKKIDYVAAWYFKAADFIQNTKIRCAFVSTNSITQGEQVSIIFKPLAEKIHIDFAYRTFRWISESENMAAVHCVIIGFSAAPSKKPKIIFDGEDKIIAKKINAYLIDADDIFIESRSDPLCEVPRMITGNRPADGGNLIIEADDYKSFINVEPKAKKFIKQLIGAKEFINGLKRYCLWLVNATEEEINSMPLVKARVETCRKDRLKGAADRQKLAETPHLFRETLNPKSAIIVPCTSSENRKYIPIGFIDDSLITTDAVLIIPNAEFYHFGILTSKVHMAWTKTVCGRLKSDYRYSKDIVYNNFVWPLPNYKQRKLIEQSATEILLVRKKFHRRTLASLYDEHDMPKELRAAHEANDKAVMEAYGFDKNLSESEIVAELMKLYQDFVEQLAQKILAQKNKA